MGGSMLSLSVTTAWNGSLTNSDRLSTSKTLMNECLMNTLALLLGVLLIWTNQRRLLPNDVSASPVDKASIHPVSLDLKHFISHQSSSLVTKVSDHRKDSIRLRGDDEVDPSTRFFLRKIRRRQKLGELVGKPQRRESDMPTPLDRAMQSRVRDIFFSAS